MPVALAATQNAASASDQARSSLADKIAAMLDYIIGQIPSWIAAFIVLVLSFIIAKLAKAAVESRISDKIDEEHQEVLVVSGRITYVAVFTVGITAALKIAGLDLTTILAAVAFGVGFALRAFIMNFFAGLYILMSRQFVIGDFLQIGSLIGRVEEIQSRATILKTYDGYKVIVPNSDIFTKQVISLTTNPLRRIKLPLYISYDTDIAYAMKIALRVIKKHPKVQKRPKPTIIVNDYGDSTIDLVARFWVESRGGWFMTRSELAHMLWDEYMKAGIVVPYNIFHMETSQDTAEEYKEFEERNKQEIEKMKQRAEKRKTMKAAATAGQKPSVPTNANGQNGQAEQMVTGAASQLVPENIPAEPPGAYQELEDLDHNG